MIHLASLCWSNIQPTLNQERFTGHEINITRSKSQPGLRHLAEYPLNSTASLPSHSNVHVGEVSGRTESRFESTHPFDDRQSTTGINPPFSFNETAGEAFISMELENFNTLRNVCDLNVPSCSNDQLLLEFLSPQGLKLLISSLPLRDLDEDYTESSDHLSKILLKGVGFISASVLH
jgi:hypothetical protein